MGLKRVHVVVQGRVQGVFFRACTRDEAARLGLSGWVRNRADGAVEAELQGEGREVDRMLAWLRKGSPMSVVTRVESREMAPVAAESVFQIKY